MRKKRADETNKTYILVEQKLSKWEISEREVDGDYTVRAVTIRKNFDDAVQLATLWIEEAIDSGEPIEYGIRFKFLERTV